MADQAALWLEERRSSPLPSLPTRWSRLAVGLSAGGHVVAVAALCLCVSRPLPPTHADRATFAVVFVPEAAPPLPEMTDLASLALPPPAALAKTAELALLPHLWVPTRGALAVAPQRNPIARALARPVPMTVVAALAEPRSTPAGAAPAVIRSAAPADDLPSALAAFEARVHLAVQQAAVYPAAARLQHREGRARIRVDYDDGAVRSASIALSSQSGVLDRAALSAVRRAALPKPPADIAARARTLLVWVDFTLVAED